LPAAVTVATPLNVESTAPKSSSAVTASPKGVPAPNDEGGVAVTAKWVATPAARTLMRPVVLVKPSPLTWRA
jgi:hypothetical protein